MAGPILDTLAIGRNHRADSVWTFDFIDRPSPEVMLRTWYDLQSLGCIDVMGQLTASGNRARRLPLEPRHAMAIVRAKELNPSPVYEISAIVSLIEAEDLFIRPNQRPEYADAIQETFGCGHGTFFPTCLAGHSGHSVNFTIFDICAATNDRKTL